MAGEDMRARERDMRARASLAPAVKRGGMMRG
jgi:hypothetical protein